MNGVDISEWSRWYKKFVMPIFIPEERESYYQKIEQLQTPFYPKYWIAERFFDKMKDDNRFDEELKRFFSFLYSCGFFMEYVISFEEWLVMENWEYPIKNEGQADSIIDIIENEGINKLKEKLRWLPFINRQDGF